ncbi:lycopene cyclase domain-containing protein [Nocardioides yefusunii]|uniref:Lycopene cyclase domain-containing protein n=1 Tax=Nocardioides yefusunii TaxID=2500546 RepID=A0ABW1QRK7_9ACTN|nr:lycopene cyclase domain-containing protein [Nocardioides yefusunii]
MSLLYLTFLLVSLVCMGTIDARFKLFLFRRPRVALPVVVAGFVLFVVWDLVAIATDMYAKGESRAMTGIDVAPHLPIEELVFITFLTYITGVIHFGFLRLLDVGLLPRAVAEGQGKR